MHTFCICILAPLGHRNKILREVKRIRAEEHDGAVPDEFLCPITREIMTDPVIASGEKIHRVSEGWSRIQRKGP